MNLGHGRQIEVSGGMFAALLALVLQAVVYLTLLPEPLQVTFDYYVAEPVLLAMLCGLCFSAAHKATTENRKWFWRLVAASFSLWFVAALLSSATRDLASPSIALIKDSLFIGHFCLIAAAVELRFDKGDGQQVAKQYTAAALGSSQMIAAIFIYFGIAPLINSSGPYQMPLGLHAAFDVYLALRFLFAVFQCANTSWRFLFGGFALVFSLIAAADLLALSFRFGIVEYAPGRPLALLWYLWYPVAYLLTGTKLTASAAESDEDLSAKLTVASRALFLLGLLLPFLHVSGYALDLLDTDVRQSRDIAVGVWIVMITIMLLVTYFVFRSRMRKLDAQRMQAAKHARQVEEQLDRELRIRNLGRLSAGLAHDFGNTLTAITMHADLIRDKLSHGKPVSEEFGGLDESIDYARRLIDKLTQFGNSQEVAATKELDLNHEVRNTVEIIRHSLKSGVRLSLQDDCSDLRINAESQMIHQVVTNYVYNAIDAVGANGDIEVSIDLVDDRIRCASCGEPFSGRYACLVVCDTGPGIDSVLADQIFEPLVSSKPVGVGSGLGLSTVHGVMHSIGGHVGLTKNAGSGACFAAYFPIAEGRS